MQKMAERFRDALHEIERSGEPDAVLALLADDVELRRLEKAPVSGRDEARRFWDEYLGSFAEQTTEFRSTLVGEGHAVLEWRSEGALPGGEPFAYEGASVLVGDDDAVRSFRTYYDTVAFVRPTAER